MDVDPFPADPRRVAARAVGRTPQEHEALERALARRRAKRAARSDTPRHRQRQHELKVAEEAEEGSSFFRQLWPRRIGEGHMGRGYQAQHIFIRPPPPRQRFALKEGIPLRAPDVGSWFIEYLQQQQQPPPREPPSYNSNSNSDKPRHPQEVEADRFEAAETDPYMVETRALIREYPGLGDNVRTVLLLATQIPQGRWTDYQTMQEHISRTKSRRTLNFLGSDGVGIGRALALNPLGNDMVPCHRIIGGCCPDGVDLGEHDGDVDLLRAEGVEFDAVMNPCGVPFSGFRGCPRPE